MRGLNVVCIFLNIMMLFFRLRKKQYYNAYFLVFIFFQTIYIVPIFINLIWAELDFSKKAIYFFYALNDKTTQILYSVIVLFISFFFLCKSLDKKYNIIDLDIFQMNKYLYFFLFILLTVPFLLIFASPNPSNYLMKFAYFSNKKYFPSQSEIWYDTKIFKPSLRLASLIILSLNFYGKETMFLNLFSWIYILFIAFLNGKRTLFAFLIAGMFLIKLFKSEDSKLPIKKTLFVLSIIFGYFLLYARVTNKYVQVFDKFEMFRFYFFRDVDLKYALFSNLKSNNHKVLNYRGESFLYNLLFFVPRKVWPNKPYSYDVYVTSSSLGLVPGTLVGWNFQTSIFGEFVSNLGFIGIPISLWFINKIIDKSFRYNSAWMVFLSIFIILKSFLNHFGTYKYYFIIWMLMLIVKKIKIITDV